MTSSQKYFKLTNSLSSRNHCQRQWYFLTSNWSGQLLSGRVFLDYLPGYCSHVFWHKFGIFSQGILRFQCVTTYLAMCIVLFCADAGRRNFLGEVGPCRTLRWHSLHATLPLYGFMGTLIPARGHMFVGREAKRLSVCVRLILCRCCWLSFSHSSKVVEHSGYQWNSTCRGRLTTIVVCFLR